jgi:hypothetical protein
MGSNIYIQLSATSQFLKIQMPKCWNEGQLCGIYVDMIYIGNKGAYK